MCSRCGQALLLLVVLLCTACGHSSGHGRTAAGHHHDHHSEVGCGQHHPLVVQQLQALRRRLQQQRARAAAAAAAWQPSAGVAHASADGRRLAQQQAAAEQAAAKQPVGSSAVTAQAADGSNQRRLAQSQQQQQQQQQHSSKATPKHATPSCSGRAVPAKLRIATQYQLSGLSAAEQRRVQQQLVPGAVKVLQRYIKVLRFQGCVPRLTALHAGGQGCFTSKLNASGGDALRDADLLLLVSSEAASCLPGMIAMAAACDVDAASGRPLLGSLNVCGGALAGLAGLVRGSEAEAAAVGRLVEVVVHEVVHVLGFGSTHYGDWRGPDGKRYGERNVVKTVGGRPYLATPKVTAAARKYFGCASLPGAPLENEGPSFSATSHFEYRLLQRELMGPARPIDRSRSRLSSFTLAALEDTGWYVADYSAAEVLDWGRGAGCAFVLAPCWDYMAAHPDQPYYCGRGGLNQTRCTAGAAGWGVCRSSVFSDGCLLVGKYSQAGAAAVPAAGSRPSSEDGRQAACYSPPQLQRLQLMERGSASGDGSKPPVLLPLLGGSYSAGRNDICYNLVQPQPQLHSSVVWVGGRGQIPEDMGKTPRRQAAAAGGAAGSSSSGSSGGARVHGQQQQFQQRTQQQQQQQQQQHPGARVSAFMRTSSTGKAEAVPLQQGAAAAACVRVVPPAAAPAAAAGRHLLEAGEGGTACSKHGRQLSIVMAAAASASRSSAAAVMSPDSVQAALSAQGASLLGALANSSSSSRSSSAACTASPVLCFSSTCDSQGRLWVSASLPGGQQGSFACPSRAVVDLSAALPGAYLLGFLACPSNALVCESMGCGQCSASGGYCSRGRCYCHMERYGQGCSHSLVPPLS